MLAKESLASFSGDFTDPAAVFIHLTGKTYKEAQIELAREAWGAGTPEIPYSFDDLWKEFVDYEFPTEEDELLCKDLREELGTEAFRASSRSLKYDLSTRKGLTNSRLRKKFPNITIPIDEAGRIFLKPVNNQPVPLRDAIVKKIREAAMSVARKFGADPGGNDNISIPGLVNAITRKTQYERKLEQARKAWDADPDPRIPYPAEEVFKIQGGLLKNILLDEINKKIVLPKYGFELECLPPGYDIERLVMRRYFPNADPLLGYREMWNRLSTFIDSQKEPQIVEDIREAFQSSAREALLGLEEPDAKRVKI